jgi:hypothetical protein
MGGLLRGLALSIVLYVVVTTLLVGVVILCGGEFTQIPGVLFLVIGVCTGIAAGIINEKLD